MTPYTTLQRGKPVVWKTSNDLFSCDVRSWWYFEVILLILLCSPVWEDGPIRDHHNRIIPISVISKKRYHPVLWHTPLMPVLRLGQEVHEFQNNLELDASSKRKEKKPWSPWRYSTQDLWVFSGPVDKVVLLWSEVTLYSKKSRVRKPKALKGSSFETMTNCSFYE